MKLPKQVAEYLRTHRVSVLGVAQKDSIIHSATLHYANSENPSFFYFITEKGSKKCISLIDGSEQNASLVIGFDEEERTTFQAEGMVQIVTSETEWEIYLGKYLDRSVRQEDEKYVLLKFTPTWWKYTDLKTKPWTEFSSENS